MHKKSTAVAIFLLASLIGPVIAYLSRGAIGTNSFLYDLVGLLWPTQPLALAEASMGTYLAVALAAGANAVLFLIMGLVVVALMKRPATLWVPYIIVCVLLLLVASWGSGFSTKHFNWIAFAVALAFYANVFVRQLVAEQSR